MITLKQGHDRQGDKDEKTTEIRNHINADGSDPVKQCLCQ